MRADGLSDGSNIEITQGLQEGQTVIIPSRAAAAATQTGSNPARRHPGGWHAAGWLHGRRRAVIRLRDITKVYRAGDVLAPALRGIDLEIERGEFLAIVGAA